jgi:hypothetical protein
MEVKLAMLEDLIWMVLPPKLQKIDAAVLDILVEIVVVLAILYELIAGPVESHKGVEGRPLETGDPSDEGPVKPVADVFILLFFDQASL